MTRGATRPVRLRLDQVQVADGRWHDLQLELRDVRSGRETRYVATLRLDFGLYQVIDKLLFWWGISAPVIRTEHTKGDTLELLLSQLLKKMLSGV